MSSDAVLVRRLRVLLDEERTTLANLERSVERRVEATEALTKDLKQTLHRVGKRIEKVDARMKELDQWRHDPVVLVRYSAGGYGLPVYHDAENPCGWMWRRGNFREMLLGEAEAVGHGACSACGWKAKRRRAAAAA